MWRLLTPTFLAFFFALTAHAVPSAPKSFAVFAASYNTHNNEARGGVMGTAFFVAPDKAITAFHVLQPNAFKPADGFERVRIWLVHEDAPAIELQANEIEGRADQDMTLIKLANGKRVADQFVFRAGKNNAQGASVETEGFLANSTGPVLARSGQDLVVTSVPKLHRLKLQGQLMRAAKVDIRSADVNLKATPCLQLTYQPIRGMSGGPVTVDGRVVGMNSFGDPDGFTRTWAVQL